MRLIPNRESEDNLPEDLYDELADSDQFDDSIEAMIQSGLTYDEALEIVQEESRDTWRDS